MQVLPRLLTNKFMKIQHSVLKLSSYPHSLTKAILKPSFRTLGSHRPFHAVTDAKKSCTLGLSNHSDVGLLWFEMLLQFEFLLFSFCYKYFYSWSLRCIIGFQSMKVGKRVVKVKQFSTIK